MPITSKPWPLYFSSSCSSCSYCGVRPHFEATFTSSVTLPFSLASTSGVPSRAASFVSYSDIRVSFERECRGDYSQELGSAQALLQESHAVEVDGRDRASFGA